MSSRLVLALMVILALCTGVGFAESSSDKPASVKRESGKVWIDGVDRLEWAKDQDNTFIASLTHALNAMGEKVTYDYLMGVSGAAFRVQFMLPDGCPSSPDATCGFDCSVPAAKALGYPLSWRAAKADNPDEVKVVKDAVVESINKGRPVVAIELIAIADWGVITGYTEKGKDFICRTYYDETAEPSIAQRWPWLIATIGDKEKAPARKESIIESLKIAQKVAETAKFGKYASGYAAFDVWVKQLQSEEAFGKLTEDLKISQMQMNAWCYCSLIDCRSAAFRYLISVKGELSKSAAEHLVRASNIYEQEVKLLNSGMPNVPFPWDVKDSKAWTEDMRKSQADTLIAASELEKKALAEIKEALAAEKA